MTKRFLKILSIILLVTMCFGLFSTFAFANDTPEENEDQIALSGEDAVEEVVEEKQAEGAAE